MAALRAVEALPAAADAESSLEKIYEKCETAVAAQKTDKGDSGGNRCWVASSLGRLVTRWRNP
jgi:hypothetical protein